MPNPALLKILPRRAGKSELCQKQKHSCKYYVWPRPSFCCCFLHSGPFLLNSAGKLACGDSVLDLGHVPSGLGATAFRSHSVGAIKQMTKKTENSPS